MDQPRRSVVVAVVDVGEMLVVVRQREVSVLASGDDDDRVRSVVRIIGVDRVCVLEDVVGVSVSVVAGGDDEHAGQ